MGDHVTFRGATVRYFDGRRKEGGAFVRIHFTTEWSEPVREAMGWTDPGPSAQEVKLNGELAGTHMILTPNDKKLKDHEVHFDINEVRSFKLITIEKDGVKKRELRFLARSPQADAVGLIDGYVRRVGNFEAALKITYSKQEELNMGDPADEKDTGCVNCNNQLPFQDDSRLKHVNGRKCTRKGVQPDLPQTSAVPVH